MGDQHVDDVTLALQMQQFLDEWHYRVLHSGMALHTDRLKAVITSLDLFEMHGLEIDQAEKEALSKMEEADMIQVCVQRMPMDLRVTFEHFALQLQLVISATTRVRYALEEGDPHEVARVMEEGDAGISQQILKQAIQEAGKEVSEINELRDSWWRNMGDRVQRLTCCADDAEHARQQLEAIQANLSTFADEQNAKSKKVLLSLSASSDKKFLKNIFSSWLAQYMKFKAEEHIHQEFRKQINDLQTGLVDLKANSKGGVSRVLMRKAGEGSRVITEETWRKWLRYVEESKEAKEFSEQIEQAEGKLKQFKDSQTANTKKIMGRMTAGRDSAILRLCMQGWGKLAANEKLAAELEEHRKQCEAMLNEHLSKKSAEAKGMIARMAGSGDDGLLRVVRSAWVDMWRQEKKEKELDEAMLRAETKFSELSAKQKRTVKNTADRCNQQEQELVLLFIFDNWATQAKLDGIIRHYSGKMDSKKHQLDAVQTMFKSFASQLEQGISTTPRSQRTKHKQERERSQSRQEREGGGRAESGGPSSARPPLPVAAPA